MSGDTSPQFQNEAFSAAPAEPNHEEITVRALGFLRPDVLARVVVGNTSTDLAFVLDNASHFDDCNFSGGSRLVAARQADAVRALDPSAPASANESRAMVAFGRSLHTLQDFYAHTNWVELGADTLIDSSRTSFAPLTPYQTLAESGFVVVQGPVPETTSVFTNVEAAYPQSAVVQVLSEEGETVGLVSGTVDYEPGDDCPAQASLSHEQLNKDRSSQTARRAQHELAMALAERQTRHECCRLQQLVLDAWGERGSRRLARWVGSPRSAPNCSVE